MSALPNKTLVALRSIAIFEIVKGALAFVAALGLLSLRHTDLHFAADEFLSRHGVNPEAPHTRWLIETVAAATHQHLGQLVTLAIADTAIRLIEGYGLWQGKGWAEWFAVISAGLYLPFEFGHLAVHPTWFSVSIIVLNLAIMGYLGKLLFQQRAKLPCSQQT